MSKLSVERRYTGATSYFMTQEQEYVVIGRTLEQRKEAERAFNLLSDEADDVGTRLLSIASDIRNNPERITAERLGGLEADKILNLANALARAKQDFKDADEKAAKWLPAGTPRPVFDLQRE